jgi:hypothetical protein
LFQKRIQHLVAAIAKRDEADAHSIIRTENFVVADGGREAGGSSGFRKISTVYIASC